MMIYSHIDTVDDWNPKAKQTVWMVLKPPVNRGINLPYQQLVRWISEPSTVVTVTDGFSEICRIFLKIFQTSCYIRTITNTGSDMEAGYGRLHLEFWASSHKVGPSLIINGVVGPL